MLLRQGLPGSDPNLTILGPAGKITSPLTIFPNLKPPTPNSDPVLKSDAKRSHDQGDVECFVWGTVCTETMCVPDMLPKANHIPRC